MLQYVFGAQPSRPLPRYVPPPGRRVLHKIGASTEYCKVTRTANCSGPPSSCHRVWRLLRETSSPAEKPSVIVGGKPRLRRHRASSTKSEAETEKVSRHGLGIRRVHLATSYYLSSDNGQAHSAHAFASRPDFQRPCRLGDRVQVITTDWHFHNSTAETVVGEWKWGRPIGKRLSFNAFWIRPIMDASGSFFLLRRLRTMGVTTTSQRCLFVAPLS
ncbi:hypothetical protein V8C44DRAFT_156316 [Trichoderma aethiopicum]